MENNNTSRETELLKSAIFEIKALRQQNQSMALRLEMFDNCMLLLTSEQKPNNRGFSPDLVWEIENHINSNKNTPSCGVESNAQ